MQILNKNNACYGITCTFRLARKNNLISKSTTKGGVRHLEVKCKLDRWHIVEQVMEQGGETDEYKLIYPTDI